MAGNAHERMIELMDEAGQAYFKAVKSGLQIQKEVSDWWTEQAKAAQTMGQTSFEPKEAAAEAFKQWKENADKTLQMMEQGMHQSIDLLNQAFAVGQADSLEAAQKKLHELWEESLTTMRENVHATLKSNEQIAEAWMKLVGKQAQAAPAT